MFIFIFFFFFFFFNDTATTEIYTLSLHDALPIFELGGLRQLHEVARLRRPRRHPAHLPRSVYSADDGRDGAVRSEEHTSELQSQSNLVCRLLLEKKKKRDESWITTHTLWQSQRQQ